MVKTKIIPSFLFLILLTNFILLASASTLELTVFTEKSVYNYRELIEISGELTADSIPVTDALVAIMLVNSENNPVAIRTVDTGTTPTSGITVDVTEAYPCDVSGNYKHTFDRTSLAYFNVTVSNYELQSISVMATVNLYDNDNQVIGYGKVEKTYQARESSWSLFAFEIPGWAIPGEAVACVNAYSDWPNQGGVPFCPEQTVNFNIEQSTPAYTSSVSGSGGSYFLSFDLPHTDYFGTYTVYVSSEYDEGTVFDNTSFVYQLEGDFDGDKDIDFTDVIYFIDAYIDYSYNEIVDPLCDFDNDNDIDFQDVISFIDAYIAYVA